MRRAAALFGLAVLAAGCATTPPPPPLENPALAWQARQAELKPISSWMIQGRFAMHTHDKGWQASVRWVRDGDHQSIDLTGPLGRGHLRLVQNNHGAELRDADQHVWRADDAEQLLFRTTGWRVPLDGLNSWVLGLPASDAVANAELDEQGRLKTLVQSGWDIRFLEYTRYGSLDLPSKMFMKRQSGADDHQGDATLEVRLIIENWSLGKP